MCAQRRMFSPKVTSTDVFLDMPVSARELYFQLGMNADDDGFITPKRVMRMVGATSDDLNVLISRNFVIPFHSGVIVITAWRVNNLVRKDWYQETIYKEEKEQLIIKENGEYKRVNEMLPNSLTDIRLGKVILGKVILGNINKDKENVEKNKNNKNENIEEIYQSYPTKDWKQKYSTGKCQKNKDQIKVLLKKYSKDQIISEINKHIEERKKAKFSIKTFSNFLKEFPEPEPEYDVKNMSVQEVEKLLDEGKL